ncbi:DUF2630 family protein [Egicoccus halophilus]|uniref:DUF2630 domain-containing protein n=1 Tax=Egicoccus halophilus TaxID=1670830 RepID=A0A8J3AAK5_9ACTN|nr:DUF2630 family protein [Egicoccus halophilus]GGI06378.1 hypothetical protein GCM10011354_18790 [Egicoccus halophilus]
MSDEQRDEQAIVDHIDELVAEQDRLRDGDTSAEDRARLDEIETELNQHWDLLRQRRAAKEFDEDPDEAEVRDPETVDNYLN